MNKVTYIDI